MTEGYAHWTPERRAAGDKALGALREAERRQRCCAYCGVEVPPARRKQVPVTCNLHGDLPARDPFYEGVG